jgi:hypothetical protein
LVETGSVRTSARFAVERSECENLCPEESLSWDLFNEADAAVDVSASGGYVADELDDVGMA